MGYGARCAPEFEFFLLDDEHERLDSGLQCYSMQKRTQFLAEEYSLLDAVAAHGELECSHYEWGPGQYEVSIRHRPVREMGDDGHLFRATMKEAAMQMGRRRHLHGQAVRQDDRQLLSHPHVAGGRRRQ